MLCSRSLFISLKYRELLNITRIVAYSINRSESNEKLPSKYSNNSTNHEHEYSDPKIIETLKEDAKWSDTFGSLTDSRIKERDHEDKTFADDEKDEIDETSEDYVRLSQYGRRHSQIWYGRLIEKLAKQNKISEAIRVLEVNMLREDRVLPSDYVFTALIGALGRAGYTKKAFQLFNRMKKFGLNPGAPTYTGLFNACANSPYEGDGLTRARKLHRQMIDKEVIPNATTSAAMIKCYGLCNDLSGAFKVVDEMIANRVTLKVDTFNALMIACISDKHSGLKHSTAVWRLMKASGVSPTADTYNLLLRSVRDCSLGDAGAAEMISISSAASSLLSSGSAGGDDDVIGRLQDVTSSKQLMPVSNNSPAVSTPSARLQLLGGVTAYYGAMKRDDVHPTIATDTMMLTLLGGEGGGQEDITHLRRVLAAGRKVDTGFMNTLVKRRCQRDGADLGSAKEILALMAELQVPVDMRTYGCLALACKQKKDGMTLLSNLEHENIAPSEELYNTLLKQSRMSFSYKLALCRRMQSQDAPPSLQFITACEASIRRARLMIASSEQQKLQNRYNNFVATPRWISTFKQFTRFYEMWLRGLPAGSDTTGSKDLWRDFK